MRKTITAVVAGLLILGYTTTADFTPPPAMAEVERDPFETIWTPVVSTDCDVWQIRQTDAAVEDLWPHVEYMTVGDDETRYDVGDMVRATPTAGQFLFQFYADGQRVYRTALDVGSIC